jgi:hypothetical protein
VLSAGSCSLCYGRKEGKCAVCAIVVSRYVCIPMVFSERFAGVTCFALVFCP